jgi:hypothetical protein
VSADPPTLNDHALLVDGRVYDVNRDGAAEMAGLAGANRVEIGAG